MANKWQENVDYSDLIETAARNGDYAEAARNEQLRNQKIDDTGSTYAKTHDYEKYLGYDPGTDYSDVAEARAKGGDWSGAWDAIYGDTNSRAAKMKDYGSRGVSNDDLWGDLAYKYGYTYQSAPDAVKERQGKIDALYEQIVGRGNYERDPELDALYEQIAGRGKFEYDPETDPLYASYRKQYTREGDRAMQDVLASAAAMTGGMPSSYAVTAAQETKDNYLAKMQDVLPQLYEIAYGHWQDEGNRLLQNYSLLQDKDRTAYERWQDEGNSLLQNLSLLQTEDQQDYSRGRDDINYRLAREQEAYEREQDQRAILEDHAKTMAAVGDFSGYRALGYSDDEIAKLEQAWLLEQAAAGGSGGSGGSGGRGGGRSGSGSGSSSYDTPTNQKVQFANGQTMTQKAQSKSITNQHAYYNGELSWMVIPGKGRMSAREVSNYIQSGKITETQNKDGSFTYRWKG